MLVINPGLVLGPSLTQASNSATFDLMKRFTDGSLRFGAPALEFGVVDVRDVALAHVKAGFTPGATGRHIAVSDTVSMLEIGKILARHFGRQYPFPRALAPKALLWLIGPMTGVTRKFVTANVGYSVRFDNGYARKDLGMVFRPVEETVTAHFKQMIDDGLVPAKPAMAA